MSRGRLVVGFVAAVWLVVASVIAYQAWWSEPPAPPVPPGPPPEEIVDEPELSRFYHQELDWSACGEDLCTRVEVPLDYADPGGEVTHLAVRRVGGGGKDVLFVNPGGPGGSGWEYASYFAAKATAGVREHYDIVGFDPRGVVRSDPIQCLSDADFIELLEGDPRPQTRAEVRASIEAYRRMGEACVENSGALASHITTMEVARDLDVLRVVFHQERLHYYGASYGTELGAIYAETFPERVGRFVLDAAVDLRADAVEFSLGQARGFQRAFDSFARWCVAQGDCPIGGSVTEARSRVVELLDALAVDPLPAGDRELKETYGIYGIAAALYHQSMWSLLRTGLREAITAGEGRSLMVLSDAYFNRVGDTFADNSAQVFTAIRCLESGPGRSVGQMFADLPEFERASPVFGRFLAWDTACLRWPVRTEIERPEVRAAGAAPILVIGTTNDPATPYEWSEAMAEQLESGVLLTRRGDGHGAYGAGSSCIDRAVEGLLVQGKPPAEGTVC